MSNHVFLLLFCLLGRRKSGRVVQGVEQHNHISGWIRGSTGKTESRGLSGIRNENMFMNKRFRHDKLIRSCNSSGQRNVSADYWTGWRGQEATYYCCWTIQKGQYAYWEGHRFFGYIAAKLVVNNCLVLVLHCRFAKKRRKEARSWRKICGWNSWRSRYLFFSNRPLSCL